jgi:signal transduction histidine kinase
MVWQSTPWADPLLFSTVVSASLAVFGLLYVALVRRDPRVVAFATLMVAAAIWTLGYSFQFASATIAEKQRWATVAMVGEAVVPIAWFTFAAAYSRRDDWLRPERLAALWAIPLVTVGLAVTNSSHRLVWGASQLVSAPAESYLLLERTGGPWLLVHGGYSYLVAFLGVAFLVAMVERSRGIYWGQAAVLFTGIAVPAAATLLSLAGAGPARVIDLTAPSITVLGIAFAVAIFRYRLFDLVPVARASVVENMGEGYVLLDESEKIVDLNTAARSLLDGDDGRLVGQSARTVFGVDLGVLAAFDGETTTETVETDSGYLELTVSTIETERVGGSLLVVRDVTDRIRLERRFQTLIEASSDIVLVLDEAGVIEYASPSVQRVLGYDPAALVGEVSFDALTVDDGDEPRATPPDMSPAVETWRRVLEGSAADPSNSTTSRFEVRVETASGEERTIEVIARYLVEDPAVDGIVINARDVTERKRRELELRRTNERLDQFASLVSHDLRNPLQVAMGHLDLAMESGQTESLAEVSRQHQRIEEMIEDLLTMARDGREVEETAPIDLERAATQAWGSVETGDASLVVDADRPIAADESRLANLFENLFRNAVEHGSSSSTTPNAQDSAQAPSANGEPGSEEVGERATSGDETDGLTVTVETIPNGFAVSDDGVGIPPDERERVLESGHTTEPGNTGFGLAIVEEVATAHGWDINLSESEAGGARFAFTGVDRPGDGNAESDRPDQDQSLAADSEREVVVEPGAEEGVD